MLKKSKKLRSITPNVSYHLPTTELRLLEKSTIKSIRDNNDSLNSIIIPKSSKLHFEV